MNRPVSLEEVRAIIAGARRPELVPNRTRPVLFAPLPPCCGPTLGRLGTGCSTPLSVVVPPFQKVECDPDPCKIETIRRGVIEALIEGGMPPVVTQPSPQESPGFIGRSTIWNPPAGVVVVQGGSAAAVAAAAALRIGIAGPPGPAVLGIGPPVALGSAGAPTTIFTFLAPDGRRVVARRLWFNASTPQAFRSLQISVEVGGDQVLPLFNPSPGDWFPVNVAAQPGISVVVKAACLDSTAAYVLWVRLDGWSLPSVTIDDSLDSMVHRFNPGQRRPH
jgi:hypothetical protein